MSNSVALHDPAFLLEGCFGATLFKGEDGDTLSPESLVTLKQRVVGRIYILFLCENVSNIFKV